jgi:hypothetical protein
VNPPWLIADLDDASALERLSSEVRAWDPAFDLVRPPSDALLYEPDGTLYALALQAPMTAEFNHRTRELQPGDLLIVPRSVPVGIEPTVDLLGIRFEGEPPDHFRERFIQVWGYDYFPAPESGAAAAEADLRFPVRRSIVTVAEGPATLAGSTGHDRRLVIVLEGRVAVEGVDDGRPSVELGPRDVLLTDGAVELAARGPGRLAILHLEPEIVFEARRAAGRRSGTGPTPEYLPPSPQPSGS